MIHEVEFKSIETFIKVIENIYIHQDLFHKIQISVLLTKNLTNFQIIDIKINDFQTENILFKSL